MLSAFLDAQTGRRWQRTERWSNGGVVGWGQGEEGPGARLGTAPPCDSTSPALVQLPVWAPAGPMTHGSPWTSGAAGSPPGTHNVRQNRHSLALRATTEAPGVAGTQSPVRSTPGSVPQRCGRWSSRGCPRGSPADTQRITGARRPRQSRPRGCEQTPTWRPLHATRNPRLLHPRRSQDTEAKASGSQGSQMARG